MINKLDYLLDLGIDVVWLSPIFSSPLVDMGYDISDYRDVLPAFGTVEDVKELAEKCHERGMKLMLDLVVNHTSDEHQWFKESRRSRSDPKRDWYIWRPAKYDAETGERMPPNNWSELGFGVGTCDDEKREILMILRWGAQLLLSLVLFGNGTKDPKNTSCTISVP